MRTILTAVSTPIAALTAAIVLLPTTAQAAHDSPLTRAACAYRDAVAHFAHEVVSDHRLTRFERRVAPPLVDAANRFFVIAQHPHHQHPHHQHLHHQHLLGNAWLEIELMHRQVELVLFNHPGCPTYVSLRPCWRDVLLAQYDLVLELKRLGCDGHHHGHPHYFPSPRYGYPSVGHLPTPPSPSPAEQSYRYREAVVPSYRYGNYGHSVVPPRTKPVPGVTIKPIPIPPHSPTQVQALASEQHITRGANQRNVARARIGANLSRRVD